MEKAKIIIWAVVIFLASLIVFQNEAFFMAKQSINIDMFVFEYITPPMPCIFFFVIWGVIVFCITYISAITARIRGYKNIKELKKNMSRKQNDNSISSGDNIVNNNDNTFKKEQFHIQK